MGVHYITHIGSWVNPQTKVWHLPTAEMYNNDYWGSGTATMSAAQIEALAPKVQLDYTFICRPDTAVQARSFGFTDIMDVSDWSGQLFYTDATTAFSFSMNGNVIRITTYRNGAVVAHHDQSSVTYLITPQIPGDFAGNAKRTLYCAAKATNPLRFGNFQTSRLADGFEFWPDPTPEPPADTDPYAPGGNSDKEGGGGTFDLTSGEVVVPNLPTLSATNAGLVRVYVPNTVELRTFASLLFGQTFLNAFLNAVTTLFVDPLEAVIGLAIIPVSPTVTSPQQVSVAFINLVTESGPLTMPVATSQYVEVDCGSIFMDEISGSALDYSPYSKFHIYLPYIGTRELSADEIRNKYLRVVYHIDIISGSCVALLEVTNPADDNKKNVLYQFAGNCATPIPINGRDYSRMITAGIQLAAAFVGSTAGAGVGAAAAGNIGKPDDYISTNSSFKTLVRTLDSDEGVVPSANKSAGGKVDAEHLVGATAGVVSGMKTHIQHASGIGGSAGMLGVQKPYIIAEIPRQSLAYQYNKFVGYPSNITSLLGDLTGFTQIEMIHLKGIPCTETELAEIDKMLRNGVIL